MMSQSKFNYVIDWDYSFYEGRIATWISFIADQTLDLEAVDDTLLSKYIIDI